MSNTIAFQGVKGANSEIAIRQHFGNGTKVVPCKDFSEMFETIERGAVDYILLPVENAWAGSVNGAYELLMDYDLRIQAEVILHVRHALLAAKGSKISDLKYVRSHPQALAQCSRFLERYNLQPVPWYDTAGSACDLANEPTEATGAIATTYAAELYGLEVLEPNIEDVQFNFTRFFLLGHTDPPRAEKNKTSLVFATRHHPSALYECLGAFARHDINLTKLESRPRRNRPWEPVFYLDFEGHWQDAACQDALTRLLQKASFVKMLGSYPAADNGTPIGL